MSEFVENVVEAIVVCRTVVSESKRPNQRVLRLLEELTVGDAPLARVKLARLAPEAAQGFEG